MLTARLRFQRVKAVCFSPNYSVKTLGKSKSKSKMSLAQWKPFLTQLYLVSKKSELIKQAVFLIRMQHRLLTNLYTILFNIYQSSSFYLIQINLPPHLDLWRSLKHLPTASRSSGDHQKMTVVALLKITYLNATKLVATHGKKQARSQVKPTIKTLMLTMEGDTATESEPRVMKAPVN